LVWNFGFRTEVKGKRWMETHLQPSCPVFPKHRRIVTFLVKEIEGFYLLAKSV
jgi:hypothetical protein